MARTTKPLSDTEVKLAKPKAKEYNLADGSGLYLRVKTNGTKLWLFNYSRPYTRRRANISLGQYPSLSLANARKARQGYLELLAQNIDPKHHRIKLHEETKEALETTLLTVAKEWFEKKKTQVSSDYAIDIWRSLENHIFPSLGSTPIHLLRPKMVIDCLRPLEAKGVLETVKRLCQRVNEIMVYAANTGVIELNPLANITDAFDAPTPTNFPTIKPERLPELMRSIAVARIKLVTRCLLEWQLHNLSRPVEAAKLEWTEVDFAQKLWTIPAEKMKRTREHIVPLSRQSLLLLEIMKPVSSHRRYVFPGDRNPNKHANSQSANTALKRMGYAGELVSHGLRSLASTTLNEEGFDKDLVEICLSHVDEDKVRAAYNKAEYIKRRREILQWWSDHIEKSAVGNLSLSGRKHLQAVG